MYLKVLRELLRFKCFNLSVSKNQSALPLAVDCIVHSCLVYIEPEKIPSQGSPPPSKASDAVSNNICDSQHLSFPVSDIEHKLVIRWSQADRKGLNLSFSRLLGLMGCLGKCRGRDLVGKRLLISWEVAITCRGLS